MIKQAVKAIRGHLGYEVRKVATTRADNRIQPTVPEPLALAPIWPLPRHSRGPSEQEIRETFARHKLWHYAYEFEGGLSFPARHNMPGPFADDPRRPLQRFRHFMPYLVASQGGTLKGKRILDIACNSGFWSLQCGFLGAEVVGFDARPELIEQANLLKRITGLETVEFRELDFWAMTPEGLGGKFDVVLNLGILYHLPKPLQVLELTLAMAREHVLLDTEVYRSAAPIIYLRWEKSFDIRSAHQEGLVAVPSKMGVELMLRHLNVRGYFEIPVRSGDMPADYVAGGRASWLIDV
jgi:2-polyprenyl-3-methyl-5-hydroxy-6-metoxy-1,4-benzoquinol methylase